MKLSTIGFISGASIGYQEGKGVDVNDVFEYSAKYGPTVLNLLMGMVFKNIRRILKNQPKIDDLKNNKAHVNITKVGLNIYEEEKNYSDLSKKEQENTDKLLKFNRDAIESIGKMSLAKTTSRVAFFTALGYILGKTIAVLSN